MEENEASEGGEGLGDGVGAPMQQFNRNKAISAVADDGFLVEDEKDEDYEDLYSDVNVGDNFLQSFWKNEEEEKVVDLVSPRLESGNAAVLAAVGEVKVEKEKNVMSRGSSGVDGFKGNEMGDRDLVPATRLRTSAAGRLKIVLGNQAGKMADLRKNASSNVVNREIIQRSTAASLIPAARLGTSAAVELKIVLSDRSGKMADLKKNASSNVVNQEIIQRPTAASAGVLGNAGNVGNSGKDNTVRQGMVSGNATGSIGSFGALGGGPSGGGGGGGTVLFVGDLQWWTTDAELKIELSKYGAVKEVKFFDEMVNGKSKGYCQAEFYEPAAATACKEGMNGHVFNGRACLVALASPNTVRRMGEAQVKRHQQNAQSQTTPVNAQARWEPGDSKNNNATVGNFQGGGDNNRGLGRGNWGRAGPQGMRNKGPVGPMSYRSGGVVGRGFMGNAGGGFGQVIGAASPLIHPQTIMGQGFNPASRWPMGRMGGYGGFPVGPTPPFSGMLPSVPPVGGVGLPGATPYVNPAYFGRGMPMNNMGMMPSAGMEGPNMGMWSDPTMAGWAGDEHGYRAGESNYAAEPVSDHQYGEESRDRGPECDRSGSSEKRYIDDREPTYDRDTARDKNTGCDHDWQERRRQVDRDVGREVEREERGHHRDDRNRYADRHRNRGRSTRTKAKSRLSHEDYSRSRSKDADSENRRRETTD
ncbi:uncharacterized protein LOC129875865 [Solanum dulcamara]|uniref:uncharacterized protein LOC129875865 n=1 Tax=Solanum dulcamara TaxID=45834 RepID=UPI0024861664|nr:uncharacterized protein LOC129875865 [Solanum dulcamara]